MDTGDVDVISQRKWEKSGDAVDWSNSEACAMRAAQESWKPLYDSLKAKSEASLDLSSREMLAKMILDVAMASATPAIVGKQIAQLCKIYGHESTTVRHENENGALEDRLESWVRELKARQVAIDAPVKDIKITVLEPSMDRLHGGI